MKKIFTACMMTVAAFSTAYASELPKAAEPAEGTDLSDIPFDFYPAPGAKVAALEEICIEPLEEMGYTQIVCLEEPEYQMGISNADGEFLSFTSEQTDTSVRLILDAPITEPGEYSLVIYPYSLEAIGEAGEYYNEDNITVTYTVVGTVENPYDVPFTVAEPAAAVVDALYYVELDLDFESGYSEFEVNDYDGIYFTKDDNFYMAGAASPEGSCLYIDAMPYITTSGEYALVIKEGAISWKNEEETVKNPEEYVFRFTVEAAEAGDVPFTVTPEDGSTVSELSAFTVTFDEEYYESNIEPYGVYFINVENYDNAALLNIERTGEYTWELTLVDEDGKPSPVTEAGTYQLVFDYCAIMCEGDTSFYGNEATLFYTYTVDPDNNGVSTVVSDKEAKGVYNLMGVKVADTPDNLPAGLYIVNGKKMVVR